MDLLTELWTDILKDRSPQQAWLHGIRRRCWKNASCNPRLLVVLTRLKDLRSPASETADPRDVFVCECCHRFVSGLRLRLVCITVNPLVQCQLYCHKSSQVNDMKLVHWPLIGGLLHLVQREGDWAGPPNTKCNSPAPTSSVPITVLMYDAPLLCGFNVATKG